MKKRYIVILLVIMTLFLSACGEPKVSPENKKLRIVTTSGFAPYEYYDENNNLTGIDIDIANDIAKSMGKEVEIKDVPFDSLLTAVSNGDADLAIAGLSITVERKKTVDFSMVYAISNQAVIVKKGSGVNLTNLDGKNISVEIDTTADTYATNNYKNATIVRQKDYVDVLSDLLNGKSDCIIMDLVPARELIKGHDNLEIFDGVLFSDTYGIAVRKGNIDLLQQVNKILGKEVADGTIEKYTLKYSN